MKGRARAPAPAGSIEPLQAGDLCGALELSRSAGWNQNEADWRTMLALGRGWGIRALDGQSRPRLAASIVVLPYGTRFAWVSMVLVLPEFRRRGYASRLLRHALAELARTGRGAILDATPQGHAVYVQEGFVDSWGFRRYRREARARHETATANPPTRALSASDWPAIAALDRPAFGAEREPLLRALAARLPAAARVAERNGRPVGFVLAREGREASQIGPLVADDEDAARALLDAALAALDGPVYIDATDRHSALVPWLEARGFAFQRPFTRMLHGLEHAPGDAATIFAVAGPELG